MASFEKDARRPIDMIPILDGWIGGAEEMIASRLSAVAWQAGGDPTGRTRHPMPDLLFILQLMREYRDQLLEEAGYAAYGYPLLTSQSSFIEHQQG